MYITKFVTVKRFYSVMMFMIRFFAPAIVNNVAGFVLFFYVEVFSKRN